MCFLVVRRAVGQNEVRTASPRERRTGSGVRKVKTDRRKGEKKTLSLNFLWINLLAITPQQIVMYVVGAVLIWLAIEKGFEPALLMPMGFGAILVNLPLSGVMNQFSEGVGETHGIIQWLFEVGIEASEACPFCCSSASAP